MVLRHRLPSPSSLFVVEAAIRLGSFSKASQELKITQPAVSHAIASLERHLGLQLFTRHGPRLSLTAHGERLGLATTRAFASIEGAINEIERAGRQTNVATLSISSGMAAHWLMPRYIDFLARFPDTSLQFQLMPGRVQGPLNGCDIGLRVAEAEESRRLGGKFAPERVMVVCSPAYLEEHGTFERPSKPHTLADLPDYTVPWRDFAIGANRGEADEAYKRLAFSDYSVLLHTVLRGHALALGWTSVISKLLLDGQLVKASDKVIETGRNYHLVVAERNPSPVLLDVCAWLIEEMGREEQELKARRIV